MREILTECPRCGRRRHLPADSWADLPQAALDEVCPRGCHPGRGRGDGGELGPLVFGVALVVAPAAGLAVAMIR